MNNSDGNLLLAALTPNDRLALQPHLHAVAVSMGQPLTLPGERVRWGYFMESGLASLVSESPGRKTIEVGMVGSEGLVGIDLLLGVKDAVYRTVIQTAGDTFRIEAEVLKDLFETLPGLRQVLLRSIHAQMSQISESLVACCRFTLEQRLARWILMAHDRVKMSDIPLTHQFLATMLGVRRPGVTVALHVLEGKHAIRSRRGHVIIRDRKKLEEIAGAAYSDAVAAPYGERGGRPVDRGPADEHATDVDHQERSPT